VLIGVVVRSRAFSTLHAVRVGKAGLVLVERGRIPGHVAEREVVREEPTFARAVRAAQALVLAAGGSLDHDERSVLGASVGSRPIERLGRVPQNLVADPPPEGPVRRPIEELTRRPGLAWVGVHHRPRL